MILVKRSAAAVAQAIAVGSMDFDGTVDQNYDRVTISLGTDGVNPCNVGATSFCGEMWLRPSSTGNNGSGAAWWNGNIFLDRDILGGNPRAYGLSLRAGIASFYCYPQGGTPVMIDGGADLRDNAWHWIVFTYNRSSGGTQLYVDGTRVATGSPGAGDVNVGTGVTGKNNLIELGGEKHTQGTPSYNGLMSEFRLSTIERHTAASISVPSSPLGSDGNTVGYWTFHDNAGTQVTDRTGNTHGVRVLNGGSPPPAWSTAKPYA